MSVQARNSQGDLNSPHDEDKEPYEDMKDEKDDAKWIDEKIKPEPCECLSLITASDHDWETICSDPQSQ